tara:strand:+ start:3593 stop:3802 length:210 start_codon:yes stop_codon:yes gene_type:complete
MGRAIDMENNIDKHEKRIYKLEGAVEEMIEILDSIRYKMKIIEKQNEKESNNVKKKANAKRAKSNSSGK